MPIEVENINVEDIPKTLQAKSPNEEPEELEQQPQQQQQQQELSSFWQDAINVGLEIAVDMTKDKLPNTSQQLISSKSVISSNLGYLLSKYVPFDSGKIPARDLASVFALGIAGFSVFKAYKKDKGGVDGQRDSKRVS